MPSVKVVIGANYGDEGKGLATDYFASQYMDKYRSCIVVCTNGGTQRGHTVITPSNTRHVFHHLGSGSLVGADTYLSEDYIINPMVFVKEYEELISKINIPKIYVDHNCRMTTPFDMIINQIVEDSRFEKHGSCGLGIWETIERCNKKNISIRKLSEFSEHEFLDYIYDIRNNYFLKRLNYYGINEIPDKWKNIINNDDLINHFYDDFQFMKNHVVLCDHEILNYYPGIVLENAQGLLLDEKYGVHSTPTSTGLKSAYNSLKYVQLVHDLEVCYITRSYITRHGNGPLDRECTKSDINPNMFDKTNVPNQYQGILRYSKFNEYSWNELTDRVYYDAVDYLKYFPNIELRISMMMTHLNEYKSSFIESILDQMRYLSYSESRDGVVID